MRGQTGSLQLVTMVELVWRSAVNKKCLLPGVVAPGGGGRLQYKNALMCVLGV